MDVQLSEAERQIRNTARGLAEEHFAEDAFTWEDETPHENWQILADHDMLGITLPQEYGGVGGTALEAILAMEGVGTVCPQTVHGIHSTSFGPVRAVAEFGTEEQKQKYIPPIARGEERMSIGISEPQAGSDATRMTTSAEKDGDEYIVNGHKTWQTGAYDADSTLTFLRFPDGNIGAMIIDRDTPGFDVQEPMDSMAGSDESEIFIDNARVHEDQVLVQGPEGIKSLMTAFNIERIGGCELYWSAAKCAFDRALEYAQEREQFDQPIGEFQAIQHKLSDMAIKLETGRLLIYKAVTQDGLPSRLESSMAKAHIGKTSQEVVDEALQIRGANGYIGNPPEDWLYRYIRRARITGGTWEIQMNNIAAELYKNGDLPGY